MCTFPAKELLESLHDALSYAVDSNEPAKMTYAMGFIKAIDDVRMFHEDLTGCECWYQAIEELKVVS